MAKNISHINPHRLLDSQQLSMSTSFTMKFRKRGTLWLNWANQANENLKVKYALVRFTQHEIKNASVAWTKIKSKCKKSLSRATENWLIFTVKISNMDTR